MSETVYQLGGDLKEAGAMTDGLTAYVRGSNLYGSAGGGLFSNRMPSLTIGALLMRLRRLHALEDRLTPAQRTTLAQIDAKHEATRSEWSMHYHEKLSQEGFSRLKAMNTFFEECTERPRGCAGIYLPEALRRTIVQEIITTAKTSAYADLKLAAEARKVDGRLRRFTQPQGFIWAAELESAYPATVYWWLYAKPMNDQDK